MAAATTTSTSDAMEDTPSASATKESNETVLVIQHDWDEVCRSAKEASFFVGSQRLADNTMNFVNVKMVVADGKYASKAVSCSLQSSRSIAVEFGKYDARKTFIAPDTVYSSLHTSAVSAIDVSLSGNLAVSADSDQLHVWNASNGEILKKLKGHVMDVTCSRFFPSGLVCLTGGLDMTVRVWSAEFGTCARTFKGHKAAITDLEFVGRGETVLSASKDSSIRQWNCASSECIKSFNAPDAVASLRLNEERGIVAACTSRGCLLLYDTCSESMVADINVSSAASTSLCTRDDWVHVASADGRISSLDLRTRQVAHSLNMRRGLIHKLKPTASGYIAALADGGICVASVAGANVHTEYEFTGADHDPIYDFAYTKQHLYTACRDKLVRKYALADVKLDL